MSFEGYYQILCKNGHYYSCDCYEEPMFSKETIPQWLPEGEEYPIWTCDCGAHAAWWNLVDVTNGSYCWAWQEGKCVDTKPEDYDDCDGEYPYPSCSAETREHCAKTNGRCDGYIDLETFEEAVFSTCEHCGCTKRLKDCTYKIPEKGGHKVE